MTGNTGTNTRIERALNRHTWFAQIALVALLLLLASCAGTPAGTAQAGPEPDAATGPLGVLPGIEQLESLDGSHGTSVVLHKSLLGDEVLLASPLVELDDVEHVAVMYTEFGGYSYVIYRFEGFDAGQYPLSFAIERSDLGDGRFVSTPPPYSFCYAAWADFSSGRWMLFPEAMPYTDPPDSWVQLYPEGADAVSQLGNSYLALIVGGPTVEAPEIRGATLYYSGDALSQ